MAIHTVLDRGWKNTGVSPATATVATNSGVQGTSGQVTTIPPTSTRRKSPNVTIVLTMTDPTQ